MRGPAGIEDVGFAPVGDVAAGGSDEGAGG